MISDLDFLSSDVSTAIEKAAMAIAYTEGAAGPQLAALGQFLIQTESVSSSKIERVEATTEDYARAIAGIKANPSATSMVAAAEALTRMVDEAGRSGEIHLEDLLEAHRILMKDDPLGGRYAGQIRTMQNWIGGSDYSPRDAVHVPPPPERVGEYLKDLIEYVNRDDMPALVQAAVAHAQFESIHPFTDGNGRIGRTLINAILRRRGLTRETVVPIATAMVADRDKYFRLVNAYRDGEVGPFVRSLAENAIIASEESQISARRLRELPAEWAASTRLRSGSAAERIVTTLLDRPVLSFDQAQRVAAASPAATSEVLARLEREEILREITGRKKGKVWVASDVVAELDDLQRRIGDAARRAGGGPAAGRVDAARNLP